MIDLHPSGAWHIERDNSNPNPAGPGRLREIPGRDRVEVSGFKRQVYNARFGSSETRVTWGRPNRRNFALSCHCPSVFATEAVGSCRH